MEIFLEPRLPAPRITVVGETPIGFALASLGKRRRPLSSCHAPRSLRLKIIFQGHVPLACVAWNAWGRTGGTRSRPGG